MPRLTLCGGDPGRSVPVFECCHVERSARREERGKRGVETSRGCFSRKMQMQGAFTMNCPSSFSAKSGGDSRENSLNLHGKGNLLGTLRLSFSRCASSGSLRVTDLKNQHACRRPEGLLHPV